MPPAVLVKTVKLAAAGWKIVPARGMAPTIAAKKIAGRGVNITILADGTVHPKAKSFSSMHDITTVDAYEVLLSEGIAL